MLPIGSGKSEGAAEAQQRCAHLLGNLTLSGYNSDLARAPFEKNRNSPKTAAFSRIRSTSATRNKLSLSSLPFDTKGEMFSLASAPVWNETTIDARTKKLVEMVVKANLLPGESIA